MPLLTFVEVVELTGTGDPGPCADAGVMASTAGPPSRCSPA